MFFNKKKRYIAKPLTLSRKNEIESRTVLVKNIIQGLDYLDRYFYSGWKIVQFTGSNELHPRFLLHLRILGEQLRYATCEERLNVERRLYKIMLQHVPVTSLVHPVLLRDKNGFYSIEAMQKHPIVYSYSPVVDILDDY